MGSLSNGFETSVMRDEDHIGDMPEASLVEGKSGNSSIGYCRICDQETTRKCSDCQMDWYCSEACQQERGIRHNFSCAIGRPIDTSDHLYLACLDDTFPQDPQTREDFGFHRLPSSADQSKLLGLYVGLLIYQKTPSEEVHQWQTKGTLVENICEVYNRIPESHRGSYYPWFLENKHILDGSQTTEQANDNMIATWYDEARLHLDPKDRAVDPLALQPEAKRDSYLFYAMMLHNSHPPPNTELWYNFGFCVCRGGELGEQRLGGLYQDLICGDVFWLNNLPNHLKKKHKTCTFSEFWKAYENAKLVQLMDEKGHRETRLSLGLPHLETFLSFRRTDPRPSVWTLSSFLANDDSLTAPKPVLADYGFFNCQTILQRMELKNVYKTLWGRVDAMELHRACIKGKLFEFASSHMELDARFSPLMKNLYPLPEYQGE
jgi:hypothetical protein